MPKPEKLYGVVNNDTGNAHLATDLEASYGSYLECACGILFKKVGRESANYTIIDIENVGSLKMWCGKCLERLMENEKWNG